VTVLWAGRASASSSDANIAEALPLTPCECDASELGDGASDGSVSDDAADGGVAEDAEIDAGSEDAAAPDAGLTSDAAPPPSDAASADAGPTSASAASSSGSCGCDVVGADSGGAGLLLMSAAIVLFRARRSRASRLKSEEFVPFHENVG